MFVRSDARGYGAGRVLIDGLIAVGKQQNWRRIYWHTHENNYRARALYDRFSRRTDYVRYDIEPCQTMNSDKLVGPRILN